MLAPPHFASALDVLVGADLRAHPQSLHTLLTQLCSRMLPRRPPCIGTCSACRGRAPSLLAGQCSTCFSYNFARMCSLHRTPCHFPWGNCGGISDSIRTPCTGSAHDCVRICSRLCSHILPAGSVGYLRECGGVLTD